MHIDVFSAVWSFLIIVHSCRKVNERHEYSHLVDYMCFSSIAVLDVSLVSNQIEERAMPLNTGAFLISYHYHPPDPLCHPQCGILKMVPGIQFKGRPDLLCSKQIMQCLRLFLYRCHYRIPSTACLVSEGEVNCILLPEQFMRLCKFQESGIPEGTGCGGGSCEYL